MKVQLYHNMFFGGFFWWGEGGEGGRDGHHTSVGTHMHFLSSSRDYCLYMFQVLKNIV